MHAKRGWGRIALIAECDRGKQIGGVLAKAGYDVIYAEDGELVDDVDIVVTRAASLRSSSGIRVPSEECEPPPGHSARMESLAQLAGGIAHGFNNILSVISTCTDEVLEGMALADTKHKCLIDIRHAVERGTALTRDLLSFSRRNVERARIVDFNGVVAESNQLVGRILGDVVRLHVSLGASEPFVEIDPDQWTSVFVNLALNAQHAMPNGGSMTIRTRNVFIDPTSMGTSRSTDHYVELEVTDTGCGIPDAIRPRIFDPFFSTKGIGKASGLGLSVVYGIVERNGGWIEVTSGIDAGTTFRIFVPVAANERHRPNASTPAPVRSKNATLLLVEDEEALRRIAHRTLERAGYTVFHAGSAEDAIVMLPNIPEIDMLVTDVVLPGMNGRRFADVLVSRYPNAEVLYTSGYLDDEVLRQGVSQSAVAFLQKPYATKLLVQRVQEMLARKQHASCMDSPVRESEHEPERLTREDRAWGTERGMPRAESAHEDVDAPGDDHPSHGADPVPGKVLP